MKLSILSVEKQFVVVSEKARYDVLDSNFLLFSTSDGKRPTVEMTKFCSEPVIIPRDFIPCMHDLATVRQPIVYS